jgi:hypothetical protein
LDRESSWHGLALMNATFILLLIFSAGLAGAAPSQISNPAGFVTGVYRHYLKAQSTDEAYAPPEDVFTPRLGKLIRDGRKRAKGEVGCLDFDFWVNGQDWTITNLSVTTGAAGKDRETVIARFLNVGSPQEIHFEFRRINGRWLLDDVRSLKDQRWILSAVLQCKL